MSIMMTKLPQLLKLIIGSASAGLATGVGTELITNPGYSILLFNKFVGIIPKMVLMLPIIGLITMCFEKPEKEEKYNKQKTIKDLLITGLMAILDLFYSSLIFIKENIKGTIIDNGWLKITKEMTSEDKKEFIQTLTNKYPHVEELKELPINNYYSKYDILLDIERKLNPVIIEAMKTFDTKKYIIIGLVFIIVIAGTIYTLLNRDTVYNYFKSLGQKVSDIAKDQLDLSRANAIAMQNDIDMQRCISQINYEIHELKVNQISAATIQQIRDCARVFAEQSQQLTGELAEVAKIKADMLKGYQVFRELLQTAGINI